MTNQPALGHNSSMLKVETVILAITRTPRVQFNVTDIVTDIDVMRLGISKETVRRIFLALKELGLLRYSSRPCYKRRQWSKTPTFRMPDAEQVRLVIKLHRRELEGISKRWPATA